MSKKIDNIQNEIYRLLRLEKKFDSFVNDYLNNNRKKLKKTLKSINYNFDSYDKNVYIHIGQFQCYYSLNENNKLSLKVSNCERDHTFVKTFYSNNQETRFKEKITELKFDFKNKGEISSTIKKFLLKNRNTPKYIKNTLEKTIKERLNDNIDKYNKAIKIRNHGSIKVGKKFIGDLRISQGYWQYTKKLDYLKIIKENPKTYQVEYKLNESGKIIKKRVYKEDIEDFFNIETKSEYDFRQDLRESENF